MTPTTLTLAPIISQHTLTLASIIFTKSTCTAYDYCNIILQLTVMLDIAGLRPPDHPGHAP